MIRRAPRDLKLLAGAVLLSSAGDLLALLTLVLLVHELTGSGFVVAALFAATTVPVILLAPVAGLVADRVESVRLIRLASVFSAVIAVGLAFTGSVPLILGLTALLSAASALSQPAEFALAPVVAARGELTEANGLLESARYAGFALGPVLAGVLVAAGGTRTALLANALSFLVITGATRLITARRPPAGDPPNRDDRSAALEGLLTLWADPALRTVILAGTAGLMFLSAVMTIEVFYVKDVLGASDAAFAATTAAWMAGMVVGATWVARRVPIHRLAIAALAGLGLQGFGMGAPTITGTLAALLAGFAIGGVGHGVKNTLMRTMIHRRVPETVHGRAFAAWGGLRNSAEVIALAGGGLLVTGIGPRAALMLAGFVPVLIALGAMALLAASSRRRTRSANGLHLHPADDRLRPVARGVGRDDR